MRAARPLLRLCSRPPTAVASAPRAAHTPVRRLHQDLPHVRQPQSALRPHQAFLPQLCRHAFSTTAVRADSAPAKADGSAPASGATSPEQNDVPQYQMTFTCKVCTTRSSHKISKQGYHHGTVLISCPGCKNRHLIADHLKIFSDKSVTLEDIMQNKGQLIKRGTLSDDGDLELWDDGTQTKYEGPPTPAPKTPDNTVPGSSFVKKS